MTSESVQTHIKEIEALRNETRLWRWGISIVLFLIVAVCLVTLRNAVTGLTNDGPTKAQFVADLSTRIQQNALPAMEQMGTQALHEIDFNAEAQKLNRRTPELAQASLRQVKLFGDELPKRGQKVLRATFGTALKQQQSKIKTMFPEATDEQITNLMTNLTSEALNQVADVNDQLFARHKQAIDHTLQDFDTIQTSGAAESKGQAPTWDMALLIFDLARNDLKSLTPPATADTTAHTTAKGKKKETLK